MFLRVRGVIVFVVSWVSWLQGFRVSGVSWFRGFMVY